MRNGVAEATGARLGVGPGAEIGAPEQLDRRRSATCSGACRPDGTPQQRGHAAQTHTLSVADDRRRLTRPGRRRRSSSSGSGSAGPRRVGVHLEPLPALLHLLHRAVEHDLERGELAVDVVLGLVPDRGGLPVGVVEDRPRRCAAPRARPRSARPSARPGPRAASRSGRPRAAARSSTSLALLQQPPRLAQLLGQPVDRVLRGSRRTRRG